MPDSSMKQLLEVYHCESKRVEALQVAEIPTDEQKKFFIGGTAQARELISRGILINDKRITMFLIEELRILLKVLELREPAKHLQCAVQQLWDHYYP